MKKSLKKFVVIITIFILSVTIFQGCTLFPYEAVYSFPTLIAENEVDENPIRYIEGEDIAEIYFTTQDDDESTQLRELLDIVCIQGGRPNFTGVDTLVSMCYEKAVKILDRYIQNDMTDFEKVYAIHDYLGYYIDYDVELYESYILDSSSVDSSDSAFELTGVFIDREAVCEGIAKAFMLLCGIEGIPARYVHGTSTRNGSSMAHAWNKVMIDDEWYNVDATLDVYHFLIDEDEDTTPVLNHGFFLLCDETYSLYGGYVESPETNMINEVPSTTTTDYDFYGVATSSAIENMSMVIKNEVELIEAFEKVEEKNHAVGAIELKLEFYDDFAKANTASLYQDAIASAYKSIKTDFSYTAGGATPYAVYPNGVHVFLFYT